MKKTFLISSMVVALVCMLVGGATFAYFSDSASNSGNTFVAGTVDIAATRDWGEPTPGPMFYTVLNEGRLPGQSTNLNLYHPTGVWYPGKSETRTMIIRNSGSLDAWLDGISAQVYNISDPAVAEEFARAMDVVIKPQGMPSMVVYSGSLYCLLSGRVAAANQLPLAAQTGQWYLDFNVTMHTDAGNNLQGIVPKVDFRIYASQM